MLPPPSPSLEISIGDGLGRVVIHLADGILRITITGEPTGEHLTDCFRLAMDRGLIELNMLTLVDLRRFSGSVDWSSIHAIRGMAPWGTAGGKPSRVAYVTRDSMLFLLVKLVSVLFPLSGHRIFSDPAAATAWLVDGGSDPRT